MRVFKDNAGRDWEVAVLGDAVKRVKGALGIDLLDSAGGQVIEQLVNDPVLLCDMVYCLCERQAEARGVSDEDFGRAMAGDAVDAACDAFLQELVCFFPQPRRRVMEKALEKMGQLQTRLADGMTEMIDSPEVEQAIDQQLEQIHGDLSTRLQGQPESTPAR